MTYLVALLAALLVVSAFQVCCNSFCCFYVGIVFWINLLPIRELVRLHLDSEKTATTIP